jgi:hypothetical protein
MYHSNKAESFFFIKNRLEEKHTKQQSSCREKVFEKNLQIFKKTEVPNFL